MRIRRWIASERRTGEPELRLVQALLGESGRLVDVGANRGIYSALGLSYGRDVIAFEPVPVEAKALRALIGTRGRVHEVALSDSAGTADFFVPFRGSADVTTRATLEKGLDNELEHRRIDVERATLDSFDLEHIALLKIDVEGHEGAVLRGALATIRRCQPAILIEVEEARVPGSFQLVAELLSGLGYAGFWLDGQATLRPMDMFDIGRHQDPSLRPRWGDGRSKSYVNNFVWLPRGRDLPLHAFPSSDLR